MRWIAYLILAYAALGLQIGLRGYMDVGVAVPDLVLIAALFIAINAPRDAALLGCFCLGVMQDVCSQQPLGIYALAYALVAMVVIGVQPPMYGSHPLLHFSLALGAALLTSVVMLLQGVIRGPVRPGVLALFDSALYTAVLAPVLIGLLQRVRRSFAFAPQRRKLRF